jgi:hypothetical protein
MMRWALHVAFIQERRNAYLDWSEDPQEEGHLEDLGGRWEDNCKIRVQGFELDSFG